MKGLPLNNDNLTKYLKQKYGDFSGEPIAEGAIKNIKSLLQANFGGENDGDCTLTTIVCLLYFYLPMIAPEILYNTVLKFGLLMGYTPGTGTHPIVMRTLMNTCARILGTKQRARVRYIKGLMFNWKTIKKLVDNNTPFMLSISNDNRSFYKDHSITIIGYMEYKIGNKIVKMLKVYDNWSLEERYVDYNIISPFLSIHYFS